jgi:hypothetical protein
MIYVQRNTVYTDGKRPKVLWTVRKGRETLKTFKTKREAFAFASVYDAWDLTLNGVFDNAI